MSDESDLAVPPHDLEAEMATLGAILCDRETLEVVRNVLCPSDFYSFKHEKLYRIICDLYAAGEPVDKITVGSHLRSAGALENLGGYSYLSMLMDTVQTVSSAAAYARQVKRTSRLRAVIDAGRKIMRLGMEEPDAALAVGQATSLLGRLVDEGAPGAALTMAQAGALYEARMMAGKTYFSPWPKLDVLTSGFHGDEYHVWASDPGVGKTMALVMHAAYTAMHHGPVAFYATEMGAAKTYARFLALFSGVSVRRQDQGYYARRFPKDPRANPLGEFEWDALAAAKPQVNALPIAMFDETMSSAEVTARCRRIQRNAPLCTIIVDTLGSLTDIRGGEGLDGRKSTHDRQSEAVARMKNLGKELDCPVHLTHHYSGDGATKRLRDGGGLLQWATTVISLERKPPAEGSHVPRYAFRTTKARDGQEGEVPMSFIPQRARWLQTDQERCWLDPAPAKSSSMFDEDDIDLLERYA